MTFYKFYDFQTQYTISEKELISWVKDNRLAKGKTISIIKNISSTTNDTLKISYKISGENSIEFHYISKSRFEEYR